MATNLELVRKYEPVLRFSRDGKGRAENFMPLPAWSYVRTCGVRRKRSGWEKEPGTALLRHLGLLPASRECYLAYGIGELVKQEPAVADALLMMMDTGLELARPPESEGTPGGVQPFGFSPQPSDEETDAVPRLTVDAAMADELGSYLTRFGLEVEQQTFDPLSVAGQIDLTDLAEIELPTAEMAVMGLGGGAPATLVAMSLPTLGALPQTLRQRALERYAAYRRRYPPVYHYALHNDHGYRVIQYWFLYAFNDWAGHGGYNDHEGDWEMICVFLDMDNQPRAVASSCHVLKPGVARWEDLRQSPGAIWQNTHPVIYVGCGSHANYLESRIHRHWVYNDYALGNDVSVGPGQEIGWGVPISIADKAWNVHFAGNWGALVKSWLGLPLPGTAGPTGPAQKGKQWSEPASWAGL